MRARRVRRALRVYENSPLWRSGGLDGGIATAQCRHTPLRCRPLVWRTGKGSVSAQPGSCADGVPVVQRSSLRVSDPPRLLSRTWCSALLAANWACHAVFQGADARALGPRWWAKRRCAAMLALDLLRPASTSPLTDIATCCSSRRITPCGVTWHEPRNRSPTRPSRLRCAGVAS